MKLKRLFLVKKNLFSTFILLFLFSSCQTIKIPVPGEGEILKSNIFTEYMNIGDSYFSIEKYDKAQEYYTLAMGNSKLYWAAYYKSAKTYALQNDWQNAEKMYKTLYNRDPGNDSLKASIAYIYSMNNKPKKAEELYKQLYEQHKENSDYIENYISILISLDKIYLAKELFLVLKENFPEKESIKKIQSKFDEIEASDLEKSELTDDKEKAESDE